MQTQHHRTSERTDSRRKPRFPRLELQRRRRRDDQELRELDKLEFYRRPVILAH